MRRFIAAAAAAAIGLLTSGCGTGYSSLGATASTAPSSAAGALTIDVVAIKGTQSFSPNPATVPAGQTVVWHNVDSTTHRVVLADQSIDTGNLAPGAFSAPMAVRAPGGYFCSIHPDMVGSVSR